MRCVEIWRAFWGELNTPDHYSADPYGALLNQIGHVFLGLAACTLACAAWAAIFGEMPYKWPTGVAIACTYLFVVEWWRQGWEPADGVIDSAFVALGVTIPLVSLTEASFEPVIRLDLDLTAFVASVACTIAALAVYVYPRAARKYGGEADE